MIRRVVSTFLTVNQAIFAPNSNYWWKMDPPLHTRIETTNKTVGRTRCHCTKASKDTTIDWKGYDFCILWFQQHIVYRLFGESRVKVNVGTKKTASFANEKMHLSARQSTSLEINKNDVNNHWITFRFVSPPTIFSRSPPPPRDFHLFSNLKRWFQALRFLTF